MTTAKPITARTVTITIPDWTPGVELSPNGRCHWRTKARHFASAKQIAAGVVRSWRNEHGYYGDDVILAGKATVSTVIRWEKGRKVMDPDNAGASLKAVGDALEQGGVIANDKDLIWLPVVQERDRVGRGSVELTIQSMEDAA